MLPLRDLGATGMRVSCLGLGTVKFGRNQGVKYPRGFDLPSDREISMLFDIAREAGINLIDTAPAYGSSEQRIGKLLPDRDHWLLCGKVGEIFQDGRSRFDFGAAHVRASVEQSLRDLRTDRLDLVLIHSDGNDLDILANSDCLETLERMRDEGLLRATGMSSKTIEGGPARGRTRRRAHACLQLLGQHSSAGNRTSAQGRQRRAHQKRSRQRPRRAWRRIGQNPHGCRKFPLPARTPRHLIHHRRHHQSRPPAPKHRLG